MRLRLLVPFDGIGSVLDTASTFADVLVEMGFPMMGPRTLSFCHVGTLPTGVVHSSPEPYITRLSIIGEGVSGFCDDSHPCLVEGGLLVAPYVVVTRFDS